MIKVLIVDDSLFMRQLIPRMLAGFSDIEISDTAKSGQEALKKIASLKPDVVTLDLAMTGWSGLTTLKKIMKEYPTPVIVLSAYSAEDADITLECLEAGAVGFVLKPSGELSLDIGAVKEQLANEIRAAAKVDVNKIESLTTKTQETLESHVSETDKIVVIGASTGGLQTLEILLSGLPGDFNLPIIIVQHMPAVAFTESIVKRFKQICNMVVKVAENEEQIHHGIVYVIPGGCQAQCMKLSESNTVITIEKVNSNKPGTTPSIDLVMKSVAKIYDQKTLGIILTGMGCDGVEGMKAIKTLGGTTIAQDESALIFGMPKEVIDAGVADYVLPVEEMAKEIVKFAY
ncbi:MAG: chemotaxis-specific protein-glutamate methyltransferase CheB [Parcubacteria group bacterium]